MIVSSGCLKGLRITFASMVSPGKYSFSWKICQFNGQGEKTDCGIGFLAGREKNKNNSQYFRSLQFKKANDCRQAGFKRFFVGSGINNGRFKI